MIRVYSPSPVYHTPAHPRHRGTIEYHPEPQLYAYKPPPEDVDSIDMILKRDQAYREWTRQSETIASLLASSPSTAIKAWPACIWKAVDENVHILYSTPRYQLQVDDRIICCGLLEEVWRLTDRMERKHDTSRREPVEWVYIICQNDQTHQETWVRMPAECFYPSTVGIGFRRVVHRVGAFLARSPKPFPRSSSVRHDRRFSFNFLFKYFGCR
jgi:hypothetical protein